MAEIITVNDETTVEQLLTDLHRCARYPRSAARTQSTDVLLDLLNAWAGV